MHSHFWKAYHAKFKICRALLAIDKFYIALLAIDKLTLFMIALQAIGKVSIICHWNGKKQVETLIKSDFSCCCLLPSVERFCVTDTSVYPQILFFKYFIKSAKIQRT